MDGDITFVSYKLTRRIEALEEAAQAHVEDIGGNAGKIEELHDRIKDLELEIAQMRTNHINMDDEISQIEDRLDVIKGLDARVKELERITKIQADDIDYNHQRILDLMAAGTVDHGKYAHLTELQLNGIIGVLKVYADEDNWSSGSPRWFRNHTDSPWLLAREALSVLEDGND